tara:strand:+ start:303 stop:500 length:198 start_codon:yes stop_codon:yes gene_type:complete
MNPVEEFLESNDGVYSFKTIYKTLKLKRSVAAYYLKTSDKIEKVSPMYVGSGKHVDNTNLWTLKM